MDTMAGLRASFLGLQAQRTRMNIIAANLANAGVTRTPDGGPYQRKEVVFAALPPHVTSFQELLETTWEAGASDVHVVDVVSLPDSTRLEYDPEHPDANAAGYVAYPNINVLQEMVDLITASRLYEANVTAINASKDMAVRTLQIGRI
jgi:flagellar basal-body rod protein FlgC